MATTGFFEGAIPTPSDGFNLKVEYSIEQSTVGNYSDVTATGYVKRNNSTYYPYNYRSNGVLKIGTETENYTGAYDLGSDGYKKIVSKTARIYHEEDGSKKITLSFSFDGLLSQYYPIGSISKEIELPKIDRKSTSVASDFDIGSAITVQVTRYSSSYTHTVVASIGNYSKTLLSKSTSSSVTDKLDADSLYENTPNSNTGIITLTTITYDGNTEIGTTTSEVKCRVTNSNPTVNSASITDTSAVVSSNVIVRFLSNTRITINASAKNGASIARYVVTSGAISKTSASNVIDLGKIAENSFSVHVIDSRGNTSEVAKYLATNFIPYILPAVANVDIMRIGEELNQAKAIIKGQWYSPAINGNANALKLSFRYKKSTDSTWSNYIEIPHNITSNEFTVETLFEISGGFDTNSVYNIQVRATDNLTSDYLDAILPKAISITDHWEDESGAHYNINAEIQQYGNMVALEKNLSGYRYATGISRNEYLYLGKCEKDRTDFNRGALTLYVSNLDIYDWDCPGIIHWFKDTGAKFTLFDEIRHISTRKYLKVWTDGVYLYLFLVGENYHDKWNLDILSSRGFSDMTRAVLSQAQYNEFTANLTHVADYNPVDNADKKELIYSSSATEMKAGDSISLLDSVDNYKEIEIICYRGNDYGSSSVKISPSLNKAPTLVLTYTDDTRIMQLVVKFLFSGSTLTCTSSNRYVTNSSGLSISAENTFSLAKIIGYK